MAATHAHDDGDDDDEQDDHGSGGSAQENRLVQTEPGAQTGVCRQTGSGQVTARSGQVRPGQAVIGSVCGPDQVCGPVRSNIGIKSR